jgi:DNA-binding CsgD family transcriptional regulator
MSIKIKSKKAPPQPQRILEDPDPILWKKAEEKEKELDEKISVWSYKRVDHLCKQLFKIKEQHGEKVEKASQYFHFLNELITLCQNGFMNLGLSGKDREWVNKGLTCLLQLYDPLISGISYNFAEERGLELDDVKAYAKLIFIRLITGNTPWGIQTFMKQEQPDQDTRAVMSNIDIRKKREWAEDELQELTVLLQLKGAHPKDVKLAKWLIEMELENFPEWGLGAGKRFKNYPGANFTAFVRTCLPLELSDLFKRKELKERAFVSLEQLEQEGKGPSTEIDFGLNVLPENYQQFKHRLTNQEKAILKLREEGYKDVEIANLLKISKGRVSQLGKSIKNKAIKLGFQYQ